MASTRLMLSVSLLAVLVAGPASAGPTSHALEVAPDGSVLFVDLAQNRLLRFHEGELSVASSLDGVPQGDNLQNLVQALDGELYLGLKKTVWKIADDGSMETIKAPQELKPLFGGRPGDLGRDGSVYVARDFKNVERTLPGGDTLPVLATDNISKIHSLAVTPYGRVFFGNSSEVAKLEADGSVKIIIELEGDTVLGLAALGENQFLILRKRKGGDTSLDRVDAFGNVEIVLDANQIASANSAGPVPIRKSE